MHELIILMTACIDPSSAPELTQRGDVETRLADYSTALDFWLRLNEPRIKGIVFVENSGFSLDELRRVVAVANIYGKDVEFLQSKSNWYPPDTHYGWAELAMVDKALEESKLLSKTGYFAKVTGRLRFPRFSSLLDSLPSAFLFAVDCRNNNWFVKAPQVFVTTQCMVFSTQFYRTRLLNARHELGGGMKLIENLFFRKLTVFEGTSGAILRWRCNCDPEGFGAHWNKNYDSPKQRAIYFFRGIARRVLPGWWV